MVAIVVEGLGVFYGAIALDPPVRNSLCQTRKHSRAGGQCSETHANYDPIPTVLWQCRTLPCSSLWSHKHGVVLSRMITMPMRPANT
jgi:hypothetical protein